MGKDAKKKKRWQVEEEGLSPIQKGIIVSLISFIPFFFFILMPVLTRDHFVQKLKIPPEVFLNPPELINLVKTGEVGETFKLNVNGVEFKIPVNFTPVRIGENFIEFAEEPRRLAQSISIVSLKEPRKISFTSTGFARWFMPDSVFKFLQLILRANWHPVRLMFKAQFFANEGIASRVFEARWDAHHRGFIFPTQGERGYIGRVFRTNGTGYFEFSVKDEVHPITLQQWVNLAMKIRPPGEHEPPTDPFAPSFYNLELLQKQSQEPDKQVEVLSRSLNEYFRTGKVMWLIPVALVMKHREYSSQVIELHKKFLNAFPIASPLKDTWNSIMDKTVDDTLKLDIDPKLREKELDIYCKNLTGKQINQILIRISVKYKNGSDKSFFSTLLANERLYEHQEKHLFVFPPDDVSLLEIEKIEYRIMQIDFIE